MHSTFKVLQQHLNQAEVWTLTGALQYVNLKKKKSDKNVIHL